MIVGEDNNHAQNNSKGQNMNEGSVEKVNEIKEMKKSRNSAKENNKEVPCMKGDNTSTQSEAKKDVTVDSIKVAEGGKGEAGGELMFTTTHRKTKKIVRMVKN